jgi:hypothetical protein
MSLAIMLASLLLTTCMTSAKLSVKLVETFDEMRMASARPVSQKDQAIVNQMFSQMKNEKTTQLKARNTKSILFHPNKKYYLKLLFLINDEIQKRRQKRLDRRVRERL